MCVEGSAKALGCLVSRVLGYYCRLRNTLLGGSWVVRSRASSVAAQLLR